MPEKQLHWTAHSVDDYLYRIASDFVRQLEIRMANLPLTQAEMARKLGITEGRVSQVINNPGNLTLRKVIEYARVTGLKVSIVAYNDSDPDNEHGPINSEIFTYCWEQAGRPRDSWFMMEQRYSQASVWTEAHIITGTEADVVTEGEYVATKGGVCLIVTNKSSANQSSKLTPASIERIHHLADLPYANSEYTT